MLRWNACYCISAAQRRRNAVAKNTKYGHEPVETVGNFPQYLLHRSGAANCIFRWQKNRFRNAHYDIRMRTAFMVHAFYNLRRFVRSNQPKRFRLFKFVCIFGCFGLCRFFRIDIEILCVYIWWLEAVEIVDCFVLCPKIFFNFHESYLTSDYKLMYNLIICLWIKCEKVK